MISRTYPQNNGINPFKVLFPDLTRRQAGAFSSWLSFPWKRESRQEHGSRIKFGM